MSWISGVSPPDWWTGEDFDEWNHDEDLAWDDETVDFEPDVNDPLGYNMAPTIYNENPAIKGKRGVCKFHQKGYCMHGAHCNFVHEKIPKPPKGNPPHHVQKGGSWHPGKGPQFEGKGYGHEEIYEEEENEETYEEEENEEEGYYYEENVEAMPEKGHKKGKAHIVQFQGKARSAGTVKMPIKGSAGKGKQPSQQQQQNTNAITADPNASQYQVLHPDEWPRGPGVLLASNCCICNFKFKDTNPDIHAQSAWAHLSNHKMPYEIMVTLWEQDYGPYELGNPRNLLNIADVNVTDLVASWQEANNPGRQQASLQDQNYTYRDLQDQIYGGGKGSSSSSSTQGQQEQQKIRDIKGRGKMKGKSKSKRKGKSKGNYQPVYSWHNYAVHDNW